MFKKVYVKRLEHYFNVGATNRMFDMVTDEKIYTITTKRFKVMLVSLFLRFLQWRLCVLVILTYFLV